MMSGSLNAVLPFIQSGKLRCIAATTGRRCLRAAGNAD